MPIPQIIASIGNFLGNMGTAAAGASSLANLIGLGGNQTRVRREDFDHHQNLADVGNPREIARQSQFLEGIAPAQANAYNTYQDATYAEDTRREIERQNAMNPVQAANDLAYMDTVYAGTSAWERLGSNAAPSISAPAPTQGAPRSGAPAEAMAPLTPLIQTRMAAENQREIAFLNNLTSLQQTRMQTNNGQLAQDQGLAAAASAVASQAQAALATAQTQTQEDTQKNIQAQTRLTNTQERNAAIEGLSKAVETMVKLMPVEEVDLVMYKVKQIPGAEKVAEAFANVISPGGKGMSPQGVGRDITPLTDAIKSLDINSQNQFIRDMAQIAAILGGGAKAATGFLSDLGKLRPKVTSTERYTRRKGGWIEEITNTRQR